MRASTRIMTPISLCISMNSSRGNNLLPPFVLSQVKCFLSMRTSTKEQLKFKLAPKNRAIIT